ncbi:MULTISPECIES: hypothetical protein [unclassified Microcoleus]|uniref:hypothetical protein n=1 Tax=unclassified Microcoleus TaxID=2642155 RepID=UPI002FD0B375
MDNINMPEVTEQNQGKPQPKLTPVERFEKQVTKNPVENPLVPAIMHSIERYLQGTTDLDRIDRIVQNAFKSHPSINQEMLQTALSNWKAIPERTNNIVTPAELRDLPSERKLPLDGLRAALDRVTLDSPSTLTIEEDHKRKGLPYIQAVFGSSSAALPAEGMHLLERGKTFTLEGANIPDDIEKIEIHFLQPGEEDTATAPEVVATVSALRAIKSGTSTTVVAQMPDNIDFGNYKLQVEVIGRGKSNPMWAGVGDFKGIPDPQITRISPNAVYPGGQATISGSRLPKDAIMGWESLEDLGIKYTNKPTQYVSGSQLKLTVPQGILPGKYRIAVVAKGSTVPSNWVNITVLAPHYRVEFRKLKCLDESFRGINEKTLGDDEIVTVWGINADPNYTWIKRTKEPYENFSDGVEQAYKPEHQWIFPPTFKEPYVPKAQAIKRYLVVNTTLWEWDDDSAKAWATALDVVGDVVTGILEELGYGVIGQIVNFVLDAIAKIINLFGGKPDWLGIKELAWTAVDLQKLTANKQSVSGELDFINSDADGSYRVSYKVYRENPSD